MNHNAFSVEQTAEAQTHLQKRRETEKRSCKACGNEKLLRSFPGRIIRHLTYLEVSFLNTCKRCHGQKNAQSVEEVKKRDPIYAHACRYWTRSLRRGVKSDLKLHDIRLLLSCPCYYCETRQSDMTLDRKASGDGYTKANTVPCCWRCNTMKSDMPWEAWMKVVPAIRNAAKLRLFKDWRIRAT
jgi:hypothetical protein